MKYIALIFFVFSIPSMVLAQALFFPSLRITDIQGEWISVGGDCSLSYSIVQTQFGITMTNTSGGNCIPRELQTFDATTGYNGLYLNIIWRNDPTSQSSVFTGMTGVVSILGKESIRINVGSNFSILLIRKNKCPAFSGKFDMAALVDKNHGQVPSCYSDCLQEYLYFDLMRGGNDQVFFKGKPYDEELYFEGEDDNGHYYLVISPLGQYNLPAEAAATLLRNHIYSIFPGTAIDLANEDNPSATIVQLGHLYKLSKKAYYPPGFKVKCTEVSPYHFTFKALPFPSHIFKGSALHGFFTDNCGGLYMFQQGRGKPSEWGWWSDVNDYAAEHWLWNSMAVNMRKLLSELNK